MQLCLALAWERVQILSYNKPQELYRALVKSAKTLYSQERRFLLSNSNFTAVSLVALSFMVSPLIQIYVCTECGGE
jgi:hypothetical protein